MATMIEKTGKTVDEALQAALNDLGVTADMVEVTVLENPSRRLFGLLGAKPARIQVTLKEPEPVAEIAEPNDTIETAEPATVDTVEVDADSDTAEADTAAVDRNDVIDAARNFLAKVFATMKIDVKITNRETETEVIFDLHGKNLGILIGKHGQTLDALQYLTNLAANRIGATDKIYFVLDVENYRERRADTLNKLANNVAERVIRTKRDVKLEPMSRSERRVIHTALQNNDKIETHSSGEDPYRYITVSPKRRAR